MSEFDTCDSDCRGTPAIHSYACRFKRLSPTFTELSDKAERLKAENDHLAKERNEYEKVLSCIMMHESLCDDGDCDVVAEGIKTFRATGKCQFIDDKPSYPMPKEPGPTGTEGSMSDAGVEKAGGQEPQPPSTKVDDGATYPH